MTCASFSPSHTQHHPIADEAKLVLQQTVKLDSITDPAFYDCIFVPGGHGPVFDLATSELLADILSKAAAAGVLCVVGVLGACMFAGDVGCVYSCVLPLNCEQLLSHCCLLTLSRRLNHSLTPLPPPSHTNTQARSYLLCAMDLPVWFWRRALMVRPW